MRRPTVNAIALVTSAIFAACFAEVGEAVDLGEVTPCRGAGGNGACPAGTPAHEWQPGGPRLPMVTAVAYACPATLRDVMANPRYCLSADDGGKFDHEGLCFREIPTAAPWGGHQCCYGEPGTAIDAANPERIYDNCTGTYDRISPASSRCGGQGAGRLACRWAVTRVPGHCRDDVTPWCDDARVAARCEPITDAPPDGPALPAVAEDVDCTATGEAACARRPGCRWRAAQYCWPDVPGTCAGGPDYARACSPVATTSCYCTDRFNLLRRGGEADTCDDNGCTDGTCAPYVCGDGICDPAEHPPDAGAALSGQAPYCSIDCPVCGDFVCDSAAEDPVTCPADCAHDGGAP